MPYFVGILSVVTNIFLLGCPLLNLDVSVFLNHIQVRSKKRNPLIDIKDRVYDAFLLFRNWYSLNKL